MWARNDFVQPSGKIDQKCMMKICQFIWWVWLYRPLFPVTTKCATMRAYRFMNRKTKKDVVVTKILDYFIYCALIIQTAAFLSRKDWSFLDLHNAKG